MSTCRSCPAAIEWVVTTKGALMPLDAEPRRDGNVRYTGQNARTPSGGWAPEVEVVHRQAFDLDGLAEPLFVSHFSTCPEAARHRRPA